MVLLKQISRSIYLLARLICSVVWAIATLPWHRMQAKRRFRVALRKKGLSRREVAKLTRLYRERSLKLRPTVELIRGIASRRQPF